jgi:hypothetical protein
MVEPAARRRERLAGDNGRIEEAGRVKRHQQVIQPPVEAGAHGIDRRPDHEGGIVLLGSRKALQLGGAETRQGLQPQVGRRQHGEDKDR